MAIKDTNIVALKGIKNKSGKMLGFSPLLVLGNPGNHVKEC
jgi:hypothetical protein